MPSLVFDPGGPAERCFPLAPGVNRVGRSRDNAVVLAHASVSRQHAEIVLLPGPRVLLRDLGSSNRCYVNDVEVTAADLSDGNRVRFGSVALVYRQHPDDPQDAAGTAMPSVVRSAAVAAADGLMTPLADGVLPARREALRQMLDAASDRRLDAPPPPVLAVTDTGAGAGDGGDAAARLRLLLRVCETLAALDTAVSVLDAAVVLILEGIPVDRVALWLPGPEGELVLAAQGERPGTSPEAAPMSLQTQTAAAALARNGPVLTADAGLARRGGVSALVGQSIHATLCVPLPGRDGPHGVLCVDNLSTANIYTDADTGLVTALARQIGLALDNARRRQPRPD